MTSGIVLGIGLCFHNHTPEQTSIGLAFHEAATDEVGTHNLGGAGKERKRQWMQLIAGYSSGYITLKQHLKEEMHNLHTITIFVIRQDRIT